MSETLRQSGARRAGTSCSDHGEMPRDASCCHRPLTPHGCVPISIRAREQSANAGMWPSRHSPCTGATSVVTTISAGLRWGQLSWRVWGLAVCPMVGVLVAWLSASRGLTLGDVVLGLIALPVGLAMLAGLIARLSGRRVRRLGVDAGVVGIALVLLFYAVVVGETILGWFR